MIASAQNGVKRFRYTSLRFVVVAGALWSTSCSHGGMLVPIPTEGLEILTTVFHNDTFQVSKDGVSVRVHGTWKDLNLTTYIRVEVKNSGGHPATVDFGNARLTGNLGERALLGTVGVSESEKLMSYGARAVSVGPGIEQRFELSFDFRPETEPRPTDSKKLVVEFSLPVRTGQETGPIKEIRFRFRYAKYPLRPSLRPVHTPSDGPSSPR